MTTFVFWAISGSVIFLFVCYVWLRITVEVPVQLFMLRLKLDSWWRKTFNFNEPPKPLVLPDLSTSAEPEMVDFRAIARSW